MPRAWASAAVLLLSRGPLGAQWGSEAGNHTRGPSLLTTEIGARSISLGNAAVGAPNDLWGCLWNPAGLNALQKSEVSFHQDASFSGQTTQGVGFAKPVWWRKGRRTWAGTAEFRTVSPFDLYENDAPVGRANPKEGVVAALFATPWGPLQAGSAVRYVFQDTFEDRAQGISVDAGLLGEGGTGLFQWGLSVNHVGPPLRPEGAELPTVLRMGGSATLLRREEKKRLDSLIPTLEVDVPVDGRSTFHAGIELGYLANETSHLFLRAGYRTDGGPSLVDRLSTGMGWENDALRINYAFAPSNVVGDSHRFDVGWKFGNPLPEEVRQNRRWAEIQGLVQEERWQRARTLLADLQRDAPSFYPAQRLSREMETRLAHSLDPDTLYVLGHAAKEAGDLETALSYFTKLLFLKPDHPEGGKELEQVKTAIAEQRKNVLQAEIAGERRRLEEKARLLEKQARWESALELRRRLVALEGDNSRPALNETMDRVYRAALSAETAGDEETAFRLFEQLSDGGPFRDSAKRRDALNNRLNDRRADGARSLYEEGLVAYKNGDTVRARELFKKALLLNPTDEPARRALDRLEKTSP